MSENRFTPGPWTTRDSERARARILIEHHGNKPGDIGTILAEVITRATWREEAQGNAKLIAAAPDLLAACEAMHGWLGMLVTGGDEHIKAQLEAAIKKARGMA